jgi:hypothetical protein
MQKKIILLFSICLFRFTGYAQNKLIDSLVNWTVTHPAIDSQHILTLHRISYRLSETDTKKSFAYYEKVSVLSDSLNFTYGKSLAQINLGILLSGSANYDASNSAYFKAIDYAESCIALRLKAVALNNIGDNLKVLHDYDKSRKYTLEAIKINWQLKAWRGIAINYELLQECDLEEKLYPAAKEDFVNGMPFALLSNDNYILSQFNLGFGKLQAINGNNDTAIFYFNKAMDEARVQNDLRNIQQVFLARAQYLKNIPAVEKIILLDSALNLAKQTGYLHGIAEVAEQLASVYEQKRDNESSRFFYGIYRRASDSLFSENNKRNVIIKESEWMIKRKEIENSHLTASTQLQYKELTLKNILLVAVFISLIFAIIIAVFIYKTSDAKKKRSEASLKQKIAEVQMQVLRAQMNPHFIFNSLTSIENFMMQNEKWLASDYLNKFTRLTRTILHSSFNELIPVTKDMEALQLYIDLQQLRFNNKFSFHTFIDPQILSGDYKVPSLIIQPFVENAIEHGIAHSEKTTCSILVSVILQDGYLVYVIEDNGIGRKQAAVYNNQNKGNHKSVGLTITQERVHIFNGPEKNAADIVITDLYGPGNEPAGTSVRVKIKLL